MDNTKTAEEMAKETEGFDIDSALNKKGFAQFLALHEDADSFDMNNAEEIKRRFESFERTEKVSKEMQEVVVKQIQQEIGIKLEKNDLADLEKYITKMSVENPDQLLNLEKTIHDFKTLPVDIANLESQIKEKGGNSLDLQKKLDENKSDREMVDKAKDTIGLSGLKNMYIGLRSIMHITDMREGSTDKNPFKEIQEARKQYEGKYGQQNTSAKNVEEISKNIDSQIEGLGTAIDAVKSLESIARVAKTDFENQKTNLFGGLYLLKSIKDGIQDKVKAQMDALLAGGSIKDLEKSQSRLEELKKANENGMTGVDITEKLDETTLQKEIDENIKTKVAEEIQTAIFQTSLGKGSFSKLEKSLESYLSKTKLGSVEGDEVKDYLVNILNESIRDSGLFVNDIEGTAKKLMVKRIIIKLQK